MKPESEPLETLKPGDLALRFRIDWIQLFPGRHYQDTRPVVRGLEVVEIVAQQGERVFWTNHKKSAFLPGERFQSSCNRRELIALKWLEENFAGDADLRAVPITAGR